MATSQTVYVDCDHKRFVRLRVYSRHSHSTDGRADVDCFATEEPRFWPNGHVISYSFVDAKGDPLKDSLPGDTSKQIAFVLNAMDEYAKLASVKFDAWDKRSTEPAEIRIAFTEKTFWSSIGTDALLVETEPTMNLGFIKPDMGLKDPKIEALDLSSEAKEKAEKINTALALHAIGHVLGLCHEMEYKETGKSFNLSHVAENAEDCRIQHQELAHGNRVILHTGSTLDGEAAWLAFHYPKASLHKPTEEGTWVFQTSLAELFEDSFKYQEEALKSGDVSYRRFLYLRYVREQWNKNKERLSDTVLDRDLVNSVTAAIQEYNNNEPPTNQEDNRFTRLMAAANVLWKLHSLAAPHPAPTRMPNGEPLDPVQIQNGIFDLVRLLRHPTPPMVQHTLTAPDSLETVVWKNAVKGYRTKLEDRPVENSNDESAKQQLKAIENFLKDDRDPDQAKSDAQAGVDELVRSIKKAHAEDDLEEADIQQFLSWIPLVVSATQSVISLLGFSINAEGQIDDDVSRNAQHGIFGTIGGALGKIPWWQLGNLALKIGANLLSREEN
ncbi:hypothetical protein JVU11DRAFT_11698 [Chiua virens]|nr:hypothetical protein JVU11DRAFT_11698 [Chiua virens]